MGTDDFSDFSGSFLTLWPDVSFGKTMLTTLVWHYQPTCFLPLGHIQRWSDGDCSNNLRTASFQTNAHASENSKARPFVEVLFVTLQLRVNFWATISVFPPKFIPAPLTCYWLEPSCNPFSTIHHPPTHTPTHQFLFNK